MLRASLQLTGTTDFLLVHPTVRAELSEVPLAIFVVSSAGNLAFLQISVPFSVVISASRSASCTKVQRRWSETAAAEMSGESAESTMRRWSMPWDCKHVIEWPRQDARSRLRVPQQDRSRSTTPDSVWKTSMASQDGLQEAIQLLSCKPGSKTSVPRDDNVYDFYVVRGNLAADRSPWKYMSEIKTRATEIVKFSSKFKIWKNCANDSEYSILSRNDFLSLRFSLIFV